MVSKKSDNLSQFFKLFDCLTADNFHIQMGLGTSGWVQLAYITINMVHGEEIIIN